MPTWISRVLVVPCLVAGVWIAALPATAAGETERGPAPEAFTLTDERLTESSGLAASSTHPDVYWTHNDSDDAARIFAVDGTTGETVATIDLAGVTARDVEAISLGPDGDLYVADIGDNFDGAWEEVWIYRLPEPAELADATVTPTVHTVRYADGPRNAEALMVHPETGRVYIASKNGDGGGGLYAGPEELSEAEANVFERVADIELEVTDGAFAPDGSRLLLRGYFAARMYAWGEDGQPRRLERRVRVPLQRQGESLTFAGGGRYVMFGSEGPNSPVEPVELEGELLPESVAAEDRAGEEGESGTGEGEEAADGSGDAEKDDEGGMSANAVVVLLVIGAVAVLASRRLPTGGK
ncbi:hypothetical protein SAMN06297387_111183 [Streptomyces zhaozhouensis]|uniref:WD40 repeat domain-containing protein n=1 Tax=Streptomyces zhaozhouensis TaxID=1300267 RepID=A0A286DYK7_9ACTN|nr:esterase-like activity of phytase family protein [Streptomyces zhaozhouensis]SOD63634.1 hypothetical protein SAMN06297387_111183 [Streptomyces zhaozhouensis]